VQAICSDPYRSYIATKRWRLFVSQRKFAETESTFVTIRERAIRSADPMRRRSIERESESDGITNHRGKLPALAGIIGDSSAVTSGRARPDACSIDDQKRARPGRTLAQARGSRERRDEPLARVHSRLVKLRVVPHFFPTSRCTGIVTSIRPRRSAVPCRITRSPFRVRTTTEVARRGGSRNRAFQGVLAKSLQRENPTRRRTRA